MSISLQKGQKISLTKESASLNRVVAGLGWDQVQQPKAGGLKSLFAAKPAEIDCDATAFLLQNGKLMGKQDIVYFGNLSHSSGSVRHMGDNLTGAGDGDDEQILLELEKVPAQYDRIVMVVNIYDAKKRGQHFGMIQNAFIRIVDGSNNTEMCKYNLTDNYDNMTAMIFGEIYRHNGEWKFNAVGQGTADLSVGDLARRYM